METTAQLHVPKLTSAFSEDHCTLSKHVSSSEVHYTVCLLSISPSSPTLLVVVFHGLADSVMDDKPHVWFINAHTKGHSCYHHLYGYKESLA